MGAREGGRCRAAAARLRTMSGEMSMLATVATLSSRVKPRPAMMLWLWRHALGEWVGVGSALERLHGGEACYPAHTTSPIKSSVRAADPLTFSMI
jgi:hypothetical protein